MSDSRGAISEIRREREGGQRYPYALVYSRDAESDGHSTILQSVVSSVVPELVSRRAVEAGRRSMGSGGPDVVHRERVEEFVSLLCEEGTHRGEALAMAAFRRCDDPQTIAAELLGPAARLIGEYWRMDICDFMKVTVVMTRIQRLFWRMVTERPAVPRYVSRRAVLLAPVPGEQHTFGLAVVEDAFRRSGWQVDCCGFADETALQRQCSANDYHLIGLSMSGEVFAPRLAETIRKLKGNSRNASVRVMMGGGIFVENPGLAFDAGADFLALDALSAVGLAESAVAADAPGAHICVAAE